MSTFKIEAHPKLSAKTEKRGGLKQKANSLSRVLLIVLTIFSILTAPITLAEPEDLVVKEGGEQVQVTGSWGKVTPVTYGKSIQKTPLLGALDVFEIIPSVQAQSSVCCKKPGDQWCVTMPESACCGVGGCDPGQKEDMPCSETDCELYMGCCLLTCGEIVSMADCGFPGDSSTFRPFESCDDVSECTEGVCANTQSVPTQCRIDYWKNCNGSSEIFYPGFTDTNQVPACSGGAPETGAISGTVTDLGGTPLSGAIVTVESQPVKTATTDSNGQFTITGILIGTYTVEASLSPYDPVENNSVLVTTDGNTAVTLKIDTGTTVTTGEISGTIWDQYVGSPLEQAYVVWSEMGQTKGTYTDADGEYVLYEIPSGTRSVTASKTGYTPSSTSGTVAAGVTNPGFDITLQREPASASCGNGIIDWAAGETCDIGFDLNPGTGDDEDGNCTGYCTSGCICPTSCSQIMGHDNSHECDFDWQCDGTDITFTSLILPQRDDPPFDDVPGGPIYGVPSNGETVICCDEPCTDVVECLRDSVIADSESLGEYCECDSYYFEVDNNNDFCCDDGFGGTEYYGAVPCENMITLTGKVIDSTNGNPIPAATIDLYFESIHKDTIPSQPDGSFSFNLSIGRSYTFYVTASNYSEGVSTYTVTDSGPYTHDIELTPYDPCFGSSGPTSLNVSASIFAQGSPSIKLDWVLDCSHAVTNYQVLRFDHNTSTTDIIATVGDTQYIDHDTVMNNTYTYTVRAAPSGTEGSDDIDTGWLICEGKTQSTHEFCLNDTYEQGDLVNLRAACSVNNTPFITRGGGQPDGTPTMPAQIGNCTAFGINTWGEAASCRMTSTTTTECLIPDACNTTGLGNPIDVIGKNVLGLYYHLDYGSTSSLYSIFTCNVEQPTGGSSRNRFCYYDNSETSVDMCYSCRASGSCFDYQSQSACEMDASSCMYGAMASTTCAWYATDDYFGELGKGFCYPVGYERQNQCDNFCGPTAEGFFRNRGCDQDLCDKLGQCFSVGVGDDSVCSTCSAKFCDAYGDNAAACTGGQAFDIPGSCPGPAKSAESFTFSTDSCARERCAFIDGTCAKDGNDDGLADCMAGDIVCNSDISPPRTAVIEAPPYINHEGGIINFMAYDPPLEDISGMRSYWCFDDSTCCAPNEVAHDSGFNITYTPENVPLAEGFFNITYFSIDKHNNTETFNHFMIYFDSLPPRYGSISHEVFNVTGSEDRSTVWVNIEVIDAQNFTECDFHLTGGVGAHDLTNPGPPYLTTETQDLTLKFENRGASPPGLTDGSYTFTAECYDTAANSNNTTYSFYINRHNAIFDVWPNQTVAASDMRFILYASDDYAVCDAVGSAGTFDLNPTIVPNQYASALVSIPEGDYSYVLNCYETATKGTPSASFSTEFTVDLSAPETIWRVDNGYQGYEDLDEGRTYGPIKVRAFCLDPDIHYHGLDVVFPWQGEFGCHETNSTFTCMTPHACSTLSCTPTDNVYEYDLPDSGSYCLCGYSQDKGFNTETESCVTVRVDGENPTLTLDSPYPLFATMLSYQPFEFSWDFAAGNSDVYLTWRSGDMLEFQTVSTSVSGVSGSGVLTADDLYPGVNYIDLALYDETYTGGATGVARLSTEIYYDLIGPNISNAQVLNSQSQRIDSDASSVEVGGFGENLTFRIDANDYLYKDPSAARTDDISSVSVTIQQAPPYSSRGPYRMNNTGGSTYEYVYDPATVGYIFSGVHTAVYTAADNSYDPGGTHNTNTYSQNFTINETTSFDSAIYEVYNGTWTRIDQSSFAEFGSMIAFNASVSNPIYINDVDVRITCVDWCVSNYSETFNMQRSSASDPNFHFNITPTMVSPGMFDIAPGYFEVMFILTTMDSTSIAFNSSFSVLDTMSPNYTIEIVTPYNNSEGLPVITSSKTGSVLYYDVIVSATEPVNITALTAEISGADNLDLETFMAPTFDTTWTYRIAIPIDDPQYEGLYGDNAQFDIMGADLSGNTADSEDIISGRYFEIDTFGGNAPILNPDIVNMSVQTITEISINGSTNPAEENIDLNISLNAVDTSTISDASGVFSASRYMSDLGGNELIITPSDYLDNVGDSLERIVVFDNTGIQVVSTNPIDGETLPSLSNVSATFYDGESLIVPSSLSMTIEGASVSFTTNIYETYYAQIIHTSSFSEGTYTVNVSGQNQAGLSTDYQFTFTIDPNIPEKPSFTILGGNYYEDPISKWFISSGNFDFDVDFMTAGTYNIVSALIVEDPNATVSCSGSGTSFSCSTIGPLAEGTYTVRISATKELAPGVWSNPGTYETIVEVDMTDPNITLGANTVYTNNRSTTIIGSYSGLDADDEIEVSGPLSSSNVFMNPTLHRFTADIQLSATSPGNYTVQVTAVDKAGNSLSVPVTVVYDNTGTPVQITSVRSTYGNYTLLQRNVSYYITNVGEEKYGITVEGIAEIGTLEIWKSHESGGEVTEEFMESSFDITTGSFSINLTLGQSNGENYIRFHSIDSSGNPSDVSITIYSDTTGADISDIHVQESDFPIAQIGSTSPQLGVSEAELEDCDSLYITGTLAWDSCQINRVLAGDETGCIKISNLYLKESCCSFTGTCASMAAAAAPTCTDLCSPGLSTRCNPTQNAYDRCEDSDADGCLEWVLRGYCDPGTCSDGSCI